MITVIGANRWNANVCFRSAWIPWAPWTRWTPRTYRGTWTARWDEIRTLRPRQNGRHFADDTFKRIFLKENIRISIKISLKFVPKGPINNIPALVQIMAWRRRGDKPLSEPMMTSLPTHICVTRPQWVRWDIVRWQMTYTRWDRIKEIT